MQNGLGLADHIVEAVFGVVTLLEQLAAQFVLPLLHLIKALKNGKGADTCAVADNGDDFNTQVGSVDLD